jgi:predicted GH43/DUF377 family glycosyl hydrolase
MANTNESPTIIGPSLPNIPWEERPQDCSDIVWRSSSNPIIPRDLTPTSNSIFNSAVVPYVVFPCAALFDAPTGRMAIYYGGADTVTCLAYTQVDELVDYVKANSEI